MGNLAIKCEVCGICNDVYNNEYIFVEKTALVGGFNVCICNKCRNEFHEWYNGNPDFDEYRDYVKRWKVARMTEDGDAFAECYETGKSLEMAMYAATKQWVEAHPKLDWDKKGQKALTAPEENTPEEEVGNTPEEEPV